MMFEKVKEFKALTSTYERKTWLSENRNYIIKNLSILLFSIYTFVNIINTNLRMDISFIIFSTLYVFSIYLCISIGLNMTYKLIGFANFAHAELFIVGAYVGVAWSEIYSERSPILQDYFGALLVAFILAGIVALLSDLLVFQPIRQLNASNESLMISSIGVGLIIRNIVSMFYGGKAVYFRLPSSQEIPRIDIPSVLFGSISGVTPLNIKGTNFALRYEILLALTVSLVMVGGLFLFLEKTKLGKALRSTADNKDLAEISGIDTLRMIRITWFIGGGLAGVSGIIFASTLPVIPFSGFLFLLPAFAVIVLGGVGSLKGSVYAAMIIAFTQVLSNSYLTSIERILLDTPYERTALVSYNTITPFIILIFVILFKPQGLYGDE